jgi:hypothetical protein
MTEDFRQLQNICRRQAALAGHPETKKLLEELVEEYRRRAEAQEQKKQ